MKKITAVLLALLLGIAIFTACKKENTVTEATLAGTQDEQNTTGIEEDESSRRTDNEADEPGSETSGKTPEKGPGKDPDDEPVDPENREYTKDYDIPGAGAMISVFPGIRRTLE